MLPQPDVSTIVIEYGIDIFLLDNEVLIVGGHGVRFIVYLVPVD